VYNTKAQIFIPYLAGNGEKHGKISKKFDLKRKKTEIKPLCKSNSA